jgi:hypothetical protein
MRHSVLICMGNTHPVEDSHMYTLLQALLAVNIAIFLCMPIPLARDMMASL